MREIECVREAKVSPGMDEYLRKLIKEVKYESKLLTWDRAELVSQNAPLILLSSTEHFPDLKKLIASRENKIIIALNSRKDFKLVADLKPYLDKIFGFIDISQEIEYNIPILNNYLNMNFTQHAVKLDKLASELDKVYEFTQSQLTKIKDLHDRFVKVRVDKLKGITVTSKFMAGEKSGGEFFEIIQNEQELLFIQAGTNSYILSSMLLSEIEILKEKSKITDLQKETDNFQTIISRHASENKAELTYCMMNLNLKTLQACFTLKGQGHIFFQNELISFDNPVKLKLKPKERFCIISEGSLKNWQILNAKLRPKDFFLQNQDKSVKDLVNEFFFEVSRHKAGNFLIYDALMAVIEIEENVLYQLS